jgi:methionine biosynthesis protein MetW
LEKSSPDSHAIGFINAPVNPLRYDSVSEEPDEVADVISAMVPRRSRVLDVGCGAGALTRLIVDACEADVVAVEPDAARAAVAVSRGIDVRVGVLDRDLASRLGRFDVIVFADVLEHLPQPAEILSLASELLEPDGVVIASIPNVAHWSVRANLARGRFRYEPYGIMDATHLRWFTAETVQLLFESTGLRISERRVTAGLTLPVYTSGRPMRWIPSQLRERLVRRAIRIFPNLFGCQHVVKATPV